MPSDNLVQSIIGLCIALAGPALVAYLGDKAPGKDGRLKFLLLSQFLLLGLAIIIFLIVLLWEGQPLSSIGLHTPGWQTFAWGLGLACFFIFVFSPLAYRALRLFKSPGFEQGLSNLAGLPAWYLVMAVVIGGSVEEILYRGYAIERLYSLTSSYWLAGIVSLTAFGLAHVPMWGLGASLTTLVSGGILTLLYIWQKDLCANIMAHVITDFVGILLMPLLRRARAG